MAIHQDSNIFGLSSDLLTGVSFPRRPWACPASRKEISRPGRHIRPCEKSTQVSFLNRWHSPLGNPNPEDNKMKEFGMMRTIIALGIATVLGLLPVNLVVKESRAEEGYGDTVNGFCPSTPYTGDCGLCHTASYSEPTAAQSAFSAQNFCFFCPNDPPCVGGGACAASTEASVTGVTQEHGSRRLLGDLAYFLLPVGAVIGLMIWRRRR